MARQGQKGKFTRAHRRFCQLASSLENTGPVKASEMLPVRKRLAVLSTRLSLYKLHLRER